MFSANFWGGVGMPDASLFEQVRATMLATVFVFIGIEGASNYSRYATKRSDVGTATILGFVGVTTLMVLVTLLPYAVMPRAEIAAMSQPSMAGVLEAAVGHWGAVFISIGVIVSVLGAYLAWSLVCAEVLFIAARTNDMPKVFATENPNKVPAAALWLTNIIVQLFVISTYWSQDAFALMLNLTSVMSLIPYLSWRLSASCSPGAPRHTTPAPATESRSHHRQRRGHLHDLHDSGRWAEIRSALRASLCTRHLLYVWARREQGKPVFNTSVDWIIFAAAAIGCIAAVVGLATGYITDLVSPREVNMSVSPNTETSDFGVHSEVGQLRKVMVCAPGRRINGLHPAIATTCFSTMCCGSIMPSATTSTSSPRCAIAASRCVEMHNLLADTVAVPEGKKWILDNQVVVNQVGLGLVDEIRSYLEGFSNRELAETLIGGLSTYEFPETMAVKC